MSFTTAIAAEPQQYTTEELHSHFQNEAEAYEITADGVRYELREQPLMHWQNTVRLQELGATYVWEHHGIPRVLVSIFTYEMNGYVYRRHEGISLSESPFTCRLHSQIVWTPKKPGIYWRMVGRSVAPSDSAARRLFEMRTIARQFSGNLDHTKHASRLELIPQPMMRYAGPEEGVIDGAIFRFAIATDPEILLLIEAYKADDGTERYRYCPVRANYHALRLHRNERMTWNAPLLIELETTRAGQKPWANQPYFIFTPSEPLPLPGATR
jgi:hypothetical protein